ncbi:class I SAM-dependent methyltransferase [Micromonospora arborensis]|uniref:class I SAM-dependent methyltransferase n=1 Tax=Micromonospora arborensis TaxID=2116518 RepID=UPI0033DDF98E
MATQIALTSELDAYVRDASLRDDPILRELREVTAELPAGRAMQVSAEEGQLLALLVSLTGATSVLEVGTYTGYSTLCMARALPADGEMITCDITRKWPSIGEEYWRRAGVSDRISVRIGDAAETLAGLVAERGAESFDLVFIDADKTGYPDYYERALTLVRSGGLIIIDNTLFFGRVVDPAAQDPDTVAIRALNTALSDDPRVDITLLTMADGITLARKR